MNWSSKSISTCVCGFTLMMTLFLPACATIPAKSKNDIAIGKERFTYASKGSGSPAVVFEAGLGGGMDTWAPVFEKVSEFTTVFAYDRRGYGESGKPVGSRESSAGDEVVETVGETALDMVVPGASTVIGLRKLAGRTADDSSPRTGAVIVRELHEILKNAGVNPPYILVGHSMGGLYMMLYARTYPDDVEGLLLVDSAHPE